MITDIPKALEFYISGKELLSFAWEITANLLTEFDEADYYEIDPDDISDQYWAAAKSRLNTALAIVQQGVEFILKGKICDVSPFLLISDSPSKWPPNGKNNKIKFSDFRTIDSQDLIPVINRLAKSPMPNDFSSQFNELRDKRNRIMHSIDKTLIVSVNDVIEAILYMHKTLFPNERWPSIRLQFIRQAPDIELGIYDSTVNRISWEISTAIKIMPPSQVKKYFGINKKQRFYICPKCLLEADHHLGLEHKVAVLKPKGPNSTELYCAVCNRLSIVVRKNCTNCLGNVLSDNAICLTCGQNQ